MKRLGFMVVFSDAAYGVDVDMVFRCQESVGRIAVQDFLDFFLAHVVFGFPRDGDGIAVFEQDFAVFV